ncbi:hypothetical protein ATER59S_05059 [Aquamicrobium terrae]
MTLQARLLRLERKALSDNPLDALSDEELDEALAAVTRGIEAHIGMPIADLHAQLGQQLMAGALPSHMDAGFVRQYLATDKALEATRAALVRPAGLAVAP